MNGTKRLRSIWATLLFAACNHPDPLTQALPTLPPEGGAPLAAAGLLTEENFERERVAGPAAQGLVGDYFLRNDKIRAVVQAGGRFIGPCPYGGNLIDADFVDAPAGDQLGEVSPFMQLGRTIDFRRGEVVRDGSRGGPAVLRFWGEDVKNNYIDIPGLGGLARAIGDDYRADVDLELQAAVTYVLMPGESHISVFYTFFNTKSVALTTSWGTLSDSGARIEIFHPQSGFGELGFSEIVAGHQTPTAYVGLQGEDLAYGIAPIDSVQPMSGVGVPIAGVVVEIYSVQNPLEAFSERGASLKFSPRGTASRQIELVLGRDLGGVTTAVHALRQESTAAFSGKVSGVALSRVRVSISTTDDPPLAVTALSVDQEGHFSGALPAGNYLFQAESVGPRRGDALPVSLPSVQPTALSVPDTAFIDYTVRDRQGSAIPAKITVVGALAIAPDRRFRDTVDSPAYGTVLTHHSRAGSSAALTAQDHPLTLPPGHYRVVVSRGPEWSRHEQIIDAFAGERIVINATLDHVVATLGYVACDFHQHSYLSPDSPVPPIDRAVAYLAEGVDFISSSDHDFLFDYGPTIDALSARGLLDSSVGVETTPWDYGHFIGFPITVDAQAPSQGALDWGAGNLGFNRTPEEIFSGLAAQGAKVLQVNHPRSVAGDFSTFQKNFERAALTFNFAERWFAGDSSRAEIPAAELGLPAGASLFSDHFNSIELFNGFSTATTEDGERPDAAVDKIMRDWMNFLSFGFLPTAVGDSDSHTWFSSPSGLPRTLVRIPDDSQAALRLGVADDVVATVSGVVAKDVLVTNGPFLQMTVNDKGMGQTVQGALDQPLRIHLEVQTPPWAPIDTVELFSNSTFDVPAPDPDHAAPLVPVLCFTSRLAPSARCAGAIGGARVLLLERVETAPGEPSSARLQATLDSDALVPSQILERQRAGAQGKDLWLIARTSGTVGLFPVIPSGVSGAVSVADLIAGKPLEGEGVPALAFTNPIYVDIDGSGWRAPFSP